MIARLSEIVFRASIIILVILFFFTYPFMTWKENIFLLFLILFLLEFLKFREHLTVSVQAQIIIFIFIALLSKIFFTPWFFKGPPLLHQNYIISQQILCQLAVALILLITFSFLAGLSVQRKFCAKRQHLSGDDPKTAKRIRQVLIGLLVCLSWLVIIGGVRVSISMYYRDRGRVHAENGAFKDAIEEYKKAVSKDPANSGIYAAIANAYLAMEDIENAKKYYSMIKRFGYILENPALILNNLENCEKYPKHANYYKGSSFLIAGYEDKALTYFKEAITGEPVIADAYYQVAKIEYAKGRIIYAQELLEGVLQIFPNRIDFLKLLEEIYQEQNIFDRADSINQRVAQFTPAYSVNMNLDDKILFLGYSINKRKFAVGQVFELVFFGEALTAVPDIGYNDIFGIRLDHERISICSPVRLRINRSRNIKADRKKINLKRGNVFRTKVSFIIPSHPDYLWVGGVRLPYAKAEQYPLPYGKYSLALWLEHWKVNFVGKNPKLISLGKILVAENGKE